MYREQVQISSLFFKWTGREVAPVYDQTSCPCFDSGILSGKRCTNKSITQL